MSTQTKNKMKSAGASFEVLATKPARAKKFCYSLLPSNLYNCLKLLQKVFIHYQTK